jgi:hypothetical protein
LYPVVAYAEGFIDLLLAQIALLDYLGRPTRVPNDRRW